MTRTGLNKGLIMRRLSSRQSAQPATSSTSPTTESDTTAHFPHESDVQASVFSDVFARVESGYNHFRSVVHDPGARLAAISAVDKEVDATRQLLRSLLTRRNALAPISLLPPEILARVFHFLALEEPACSVEHVVQGLGWIKATHVCRFWRQVALGDASLWAKISGAPTNAEWVSEMLVRARNAPLDIDIDIYRNPEMLLMFPPHVSHTRELRLHELSTLHSDGIRGICSREAPVLEHFELEVSVASPITFQEFGGTTLFKGRAPRLRTFSLSQILIPWSHIPRGQLTKLKIVLFNEVSNADAHSQSDQLIDLLVNCPGLEILVLDSCLPSQLTQLPHGQTIHLPRLSRLCLSGPSSRITNLFKMLKLPSSATLHFHCVSEDTSTHNDHPLLPLLSAHFQSPAPIEFKDINVTVSCMDGLLHVIASTSFPRSRFRHARDCESDRDGDAEFVLCFDGLPQLELGWTNLLEPVCKMLHISNLESLSICTDIEDVGVINWVELFKRCTQVTALQAMGLGTSSLVRALTAPKLTNTKAGGKGKKKRRDNRGGTPAQPATVVHAHAPIFPNLTALSLVRLDFSENVHPSGLLFNVVERGLQQRRSARRAPLKTLNIESCIITTKRAMALKKHVQEFDWDRDEGYMDDLEDFGDYDSDFIEPGARWEDYFVGTTQTEWDWWENYSDGW